MKLTLKLIGVMSGALLLLGSQNQVDLQATSPKAPPGLTFANTSDPLDPAPTSPVSTRAAEFSHEQLAQIALGEAKATLEVVDRPGLGSGLAGIVSNYATGTIDVYYKGALDPEFAETVKAVNEKTPVKVIPVEHSWAEIDAEIHRILATAERVDGIAGVAADQEFDGLRILLEEGVPVSAVQAHISTEFPVRYETTHVELNPAVAWRWGDEPPWSGGAIIETTGSRCTSGFAIENTLQTVEGLLFAKHCGANQSWYAHGSGAFIGYANGPISNHDAMAMIWPTGTPGFLSVQGRIFAGPYNSTVTRPVKGSGSTSMTR